MKIVNSVLERSLTWLFGIVLRRPRTALGISLAAIVLLSAGMPGLRIDVTNESLFHPQDKALLQYERFQAQFGRDDVVVAAVASPAVFTPAFLAKLEAFHRDLEKSVPFVDQVTSLVNVTSVAAQRGEIRIDDLRKVWPTPGQDFAAFRKSVLDNPLYRNVVISEDGGTTAVIVRPNAYAASVETSFRDRVISLHDRLMQRPDAEPANDFTRDVSAQAAAAATTRPLATYQLQQFVAAVQEVAQRHRSPDFAIELAGGSLISVQHAAQIHADFGRLIPIAFGFVFAILYLLLRRPSAVFLPLAIMMGTILSTLGLMGWLGWPVTPVIVALPPMILTACVGEAVHIMSAYFERQNRMDDHKQALASALRHSGVPVIYTSITTAAGFLSFIGADIKPIADFGILTAFGVMLSLVLTLVITPAALILMRAPKKDAAYVRRWQWQGRWIVRLTDFSLRHPLKVILAMVLLVAVMVPGVTRLHFSHDTLRWLPETEPVRVNTLAFDEIFHGSIPLEVIVDTGRPNGIYAPEFMRRLEAFQAYAEDLQPAGVEMGRATSVVDTLKRIHSVMNGGAAASIPNDAKLVAQELLLFEGSGAEDVGKLIDSQFSLVRVTVRMTWADAVDYLPVRNQLAQKATEIFGDVATVTVTGAVDLISRALVSVMRSMASSYLIAAITISLMMIVLLRSWTLGLVSMIPNILPIFISLAVMGYLGLPLDMFTVLFGDIALGLAVDDTIHFMHGYQRRRRAGVPFERSIRETVASSGVATLFTTVAMTLGFSVFLFSSIGALTNFGLVLGLTILCAWLTEVFFGPALLHLYERLHGAPATDAVESDHDDDVGSAVTATGSKH